MHAYKLTIEYEGTRYHGWQGQKNARTVAGELRRAIESAAGPLIDLGGAGRTDKGVHALAQVAHLRLAGAHDPDVLRRAVNSALPADVHVLTLAPAAPRFHARHAAESRAYLFQIALRRTAFHKRFTWFVEEPLDLDLMRRAAAAVVGRHDFALFAERPRDETSTLVTVARAELAQSGALVLARFEATHFLWKMVRRLVGALVRVGLRELSLAEFEALLRAEPPAPERGTVAGWTAASSGLFLEGVRYPGDEEWGEMRAVTPIALALENGSAGRSEIRSST